MSQPGQHPLFARRAPWLVLWLGVIAGTAGAAELSISLPLGPYWRPGKYIPVHLKATIPEAGAYWLGLAGEQAFEPVPSSITGRGASRTSVNVADGRLDAVVPWLVMDFRAARPRLFIETRSESALGPELRILGESERLVGWTTPDPAFARQLIRAPKLIPVQLDPARPIRGHAAAWELLDAVILDAQSGARLASEQIESLLACGVTIAIRTDRPPRADYWPWKKMGDYSVLSFQPAGPTTAGYHPNALAPVETWEPGWSWSFRRRMLLLAGAVVVPLLGLALWRPPLGWLYAAAYATIVTIALARWWGAQVLVQQAAGEIIILGPGLTQTDSWTYQTASQDRVATLRWNQVTRPIFASRAGLDDVWMSLNCDTSGQPGEFDIRLPAGRRIAFMHRMVVPRAPRTTPELPVTSPMGRLAQKLYLPEEGKLVGQLRTAPASSPAYGYVEIQAWNAVVIDRR